MSDLLDKPTNRGYSTIFGGQNQLIGDKYLPYKATEVNRIMDPAGAYIAKDAISKTDPIVAPEVAEPITMPDEQATARARRRKIAAMQARSGRASTMLTGSNDGTRLGG